MLSWNFFRLFCILSLFNFSVSVGFEKEYHQSYVLKGEAFWKSFRGYQTSLKQLGAWVIPGIISSIETKREELFLHDSGDNLDKIGLEMEAISSFDRDGIPFLVNYLGQVQGNRNCDIALRSALVTGLSRFVSAERVAKGIPFGNVDEVNTFLDKEFPGMKGSSQEIAVDKGTLDFIDQQLGKGTSLLIMEP